MRPKVIIESAYRPRAPYTLEGNIEFAERLCARAVREGLNPFASHLFYTRFLDDSDEEERATGIRLGIEMGIHAQLIWVCLRVGELLSTGMVYGINRYLALDKHIQVHVCHPDGELIEIIEEKNRR